MGRKKARPIRSAGVRKEVDIPSSNRAEKRLENGAHCEAMGDSGIEESSECWKPVYVDVDRSNWTSEEHFDIAEAILHNVEFANGIIDHRLIDNSFRESSYSLRFQLPNTEESYFRLGQWPVLSAYSISFEYIVSEEVLFFGIFDGPDEGVSGLAHLVSLKFLGLRLISEVGDSGSVPSIKVRVEILQNAFEACVSLLEIAKQPWRRSMINVMSWLRPEVITSEARYGSVHFEMDSHNAHPEAGDSTCSRKHTEFDAACFYEAIKPSKEDPMLEDELPDLLPQLRPYQRRASYWMVQREKGVSKSPGEKIQSQQSAPFCIPVVFLETNSGMFYNPFNGSISLLPDSSLTSYVPGGILADEMGLGKTIELIACILAHRKPSLEDGMVSDSIVAAVGSQIKRQKVERVECICGAACENNKYKGIWVQCDICDAWQHADCVGYSPQKEHLVSNEVYERKGSKKVLPVQSKRQTQKKATSKIIEIDGSYVCPLCLELAEAANSKISATATLIVCPAPILAQWHSELLRHTKPGALKMHIYEGAKSLGSSVLGVHTSELAAADVVLTTYDVLKEDLSHDSDRHDGDRRFMRFQKRYPVIPTLLTRIHWWRLCLDEAQMVECNTASVTEMAMRLSAQHRWCITGTPIQRKLDDMYGLLRFLRASPYDVYKWWVEIIRDPYEWRDIAAMGFVHKFFKQIMWRSSKVHVAQELQLPPQTETLSWLMFSPIEEHFYQKQHETCVTYANEIIQSLKAGITNGRSISDNGDSCNVVLSHSEVAKLMFPLLKLRQACCHPQVGSSALCSLQTTPLTMEEILEVLIGKARTEGEEALRQVAVALNGLAALAIIGQDNKEAVARYKEALHLCDENSEDFRLDPLLNLHIHHNLAEILPNVSEYMQQCPFMGAHLSENTEDNSSTKKNHEENRDKHGAVRIIRHYVKRRKIVDSSISDLTHNGRPLGQHAEHHSFESSSATIDKDQYDGLGCNSQYQPSSRCYADSCLRRTCDDIKQKYLSVFISKLSVAQQEFEVSYMQVCNMSKECQDLSTVWWLHALSLIEQDKDSSEVLIKKIDEAVLKAASSSKSSKVPTRFPTISSLKYSIQTGLDSLETSRKDLIDRLLEIDQTMTTPRDADIERVRYCPDCGDGYGSLCFHCELNDVFKAYEARLFLLTKGNNNSVVTSVEEALHLQKQNEELNKFFRDQKTSIEPSDGESISRRGRVKIQVSRNPSILLITLGAIKSYFKGKLGRQGMASARRHMLLFEAMRKEFAQARSLSFAQAQLLGAHDEIRMSISRLRLKLTEDEPIASNVLGRDQLLPYSLQYSSDKFTSLSALARVKGQLRYLKGLASKKKTKYEHAIFSSKPEDNFAPPEREESACLSKTSDEPCPICHDEFCYQKMVFQCGHLVCCKCYLKMMEQMEVRFGKGQRNWMVCPTCRQHTDIENIAFLDEKHNNGGNLVANTAQSQDTSESSLVVRGSYGTKIEAVTRRILQIMSTDQEGKVLVFSSWNDVLDVLQHALDANGITYVRMKGGRKSQIAIARFQEQRSTGGGEKMAEHLSKSRPIRVLLILIQHGANGLNLLEARHVILVEPLLNPAAEAQAISRVHRIGQEKHTLVHRFIVKSTVEDSIYKLNRSRIASRVMGAKFKHQDKPALTIQDVESLFASVTPCELPEEVGEPSESMSHLPPSVAAGLAAERRLMHGPS